jgi:putative hydroxymethylpyrimidine transport system substrate-binding protein
MVPDLESLADQAARAAAEAAAWAETRRRYREAPSGPSVDTPSRPSVPAIALRPAEPIEPPPVTPLRIMLDGYPSPRHAALLVARERRLFASRGLAVTLATPADPDVPSKLLAASRIDLAVARQPLLHLQVDRGLPLVRVATLVAMPLSALVVREDGSIETPAQLAGSRIGHADIDSRDVLLAALKRGAAIRDDEVETEALHFRLGDALREGRVDGVIGAMRHLLPRQLADEGLATRVLRIEELGIPLHDGLVLLANRDHLAPQRDAIRRLVAAIEEATAWIANHPEEAWSLMANAEPGLDTAVNREAWEMVRSRLSLSPAALDQGRYRRFEEYLFEAGLIQERHPVSRLAIDPGAAPR